MSASATPWTVACQTSLCITNSQSFHKLMSIKLVMPYKHVILCRPFSSCLQSFPASGAFPMSQLLGSKITADGDCSHEIKRHLLLGRKAMTNLDSILKSRDVTLPTKVHLVKVMVFPVVMYGCESWTINKTEHPRMDVFELWC